MSGLSPDAVAPVLCSELGALCPSGAQAGRHRNLGLGRRSPTATRAAVAGDRHLLGRWSPSPWLPRPVRTVQGSGTFQGEAAGGDAGLPACPHMSHWRNTRRKAGPSRSPWSQPWSGTFRSPGGKTKTKSPFGCPGVDLETWGELAWRLPEGGSARWGAEGSQDQGTRGGLGGQRRGPRPGEAGVPGPGGRLHRTGRSGTEESSARPPGSPSARDAGPRAHWPPRPHSSERRFLGVGGARGGRRGNARRTALRRPLSGGASGGPDGPSHLQPHPPARARVCVCEARECERPCAACAGGRPLCE